MTYLENAKQYTGSDLENIFFRPILTGQSAQDLGVRVLYNMPQAARIQLWDGQRNILQKFRVVGTGMLYIMRIPRSSALGPEISGRKKMFSRSEPVYCFAFSR